MERERPRLKYILIALVLVSIAVFSFFYFRGEMATPREIQVSNEEEEGFSEEDRSVSEFFNLNTSDTNANGEVVPFTQGEDERCNLYGLEIEQGVAINDATCVVGPER